MFASWGICWMHKPQKRTLELELPMERQLVLVLCWGPARDSAGLWADVLAVPHSAVWGGACPLCFAWVARPSGTPKDVLPAHAFSSSHLVEI